MKTFFSFISDYNGKDEFLNITGFDSNGCVSWMGTTATVVKCGCHDNGYFRQCFHENSHFCGCHGGSLYSNRCHGNRSREIFPWQQSTTVHVNNSFVDCCYEKRPTQKNQTTWLNIKKLPKPNHPTKPNHPNSNHHADSRQHSNFLKNPGQNSFKYNSYNWITTHCIYRSPEFSLFVSNIRVAS